MGGVAPSGPTAPAATRRAGGAGVVDARAIFAHGPAGEGAVAPAPRGGANAKQVPFASGMSIDSSSPSRISVIGPRPPIIADPADAQKTVGYNATPKMAESAPRTTPREILAAAGKLDAEVIAVKLRGKTVDLHTPIDGAAAADLAP